MAENILRGQQALVTGADSGIGRAIAVAMARAGANVAANYVGKKSAVKEVVEEITKNKVEGFAIKADVSREKQVLKMFKAVKQRFGTLDILVNNAGIQLDAAFDKMTLKQWQRVIDVNLTGQFLCAREAVKEFKSRGVKKKISRSAGKIICMSSVHEIIPWARHTNYAASKGGIHLMMRSIAQAVGPLKIRVNAIGPGAIQTPINEAVWKNYNKKQKLLDLIPYKRIGVPEDVAKLAVWLASDESDYITGTTLYIDGGMTLYPGFSKGG